METRNGLILAAYSIYIDIIHTYDEDGEIWGMIFYVPFLCCRMLPLWCESHQWVSSRNAFLWRHGECILALVSNPQHITAFHAMGCFKTVCCFCVVHVMSVKGLVIFSNWHDDQRLLFLTKLKNG